MSHSSLLSVQTAPCSSGQVLPMAPVAIPCAPLHVGRALLPAGTLLQDQEGKDIFLVTGRTWMRHIPTPCPLLEALTPVTGGPMELRAVRKSWSVAVITLSDKGFAGQREDKSGPALMEAAVAALQPGYTRLFLLPDSVPQLRALTAELALGQQFHLVLCTGGTGLAPSDLTPEALLPLADRVLPGFQTAMMVASLQKTPHAVLSRAFAAVMGSCLVLALPGSPKAALENFAAVAPALPHALEKLAGDQSDCARL